MNVARAVKARGDMTVHQAKGMQWPVVLVPALLKNRFPAKKPGGRNVWHLLPRDGVKGQPRFEGTIEDERRLFYVAMTRSQKFLHLTWAPIPGNQLFQKRSPFWDDILVSKHVKRKAPDYAARKRLPPMPRAGVANVVFSFSNLKYFFECPYQFKLRVLYGFNAPIHEALGYGKSLHVDLKSNDRAQQEDVTEAQLHVYALGYQELTGQRPDYVEIYELDERKRKPRSVDDEFIEEVKMRTRDAAAALRSGALPADPAPKKCAKCDYRGMCASARLGP